MDIKRIIENTDTITGRIFDWSIQVLIFLSIVAFSIETLPDIEETVREILIVMEVIIVLIFTLEYILRLYVADRKLKYMFSFYGIIDLIAILPFYISTGLDLRSLRIFRMLRIIRLSKMIRYSDAVARFSKAFTIAKEEFILFMVTTVMLLYLSAVGIYHFENKVQPEAFSSIFHSLWWAVATLTTVGYGDVYPVTMGGKIFTFFILIIGLGIVAAPAGLLASALSQARTESREEK